MTGEEHSYTIRIHRESAGDVWAEVVELPGCFASGRDMSELRAALAEAIGLYLSEPGHEVRVELQDEPGITEQRIHARVA